MKSLRTLAASTTLTAVLLFGTTIANAGLLISDRSQPAIAETTSATDPCSTDASFTSVITAGFTSVIIAGFTSVIIAGATDDGQTTCSVIIAG